MGSGSVNPELLSEALRLVTIGAMTERRALEQEIVRLRQEVEALRAEEPVG